MSLLSYITTAPTELSGTTNKTNTQVKMSPYRLGYRYYIRLDLFSYRLRMALRYLH